MKNSVPVIKRKKFRLAVKWLLVLLVYFAAYLFLTVANYDLAKPLLMIPVAVFISMKEDVLTAGLSGVFCGFLLDAAMGKIFGYNAIVMMVCCVAASLLFLYLMRQNLFSVLMVTAGVCVVQGGLDFLFYYAMWSEPHAGQVFLNSYFAAWIFTLLCTPVVYLILRAIWKRFSDAPRVSPEEQSEWITRE